MSFDQFRRVLTKRCRDPAHQVRVSTSLIGERIENPEGRAG